MVTILGELLRPEPEVTHSRSPVVVATPIRRASVAVRIDDTVTFATATEEKMSRSHTQPCYSERNRHVGRKIIIKLFEAQHHCHACYKGQLFRHASVLGISSGSTPLHLRRPLNLRRCNSILSCLQNPRMIAVSLTLSSFYLVPRQS